MWSRSCGSDAVLLHATQAGPQTHRDAFTARLHGRVLSPFPGVSSTCGGQEGAGTLRTASLREIGAFGGDFRSKNVVMLGGNIACVIGLSCNVSKSLSVPVCGVISRLKKTVTKRASEREINQISLRFNLCDGFLFPEDATSVLR